MNWPTLPCFLREHHVELILHYAEGTVSAILPGSHFLHETKETPLNDDRKHESTVRI